MSVRKRSWTTSKGESREAWIVDYTDMQGERHIETFGKKKKADERHDEVRVDVRSGVHVSPSKSITVKEAGENWIKSAEAYGLERTTVDQYRQHLQFHINPVIGPRKLSDLTAPEVRKFEDKLRTEVLDKPDRLRGKKRSPAMIRKVLVSLGSILADAQEQGLAARNAVRDLRRNRRRGKDQDGEKRQKRKLKIGVDVPSPDEIKAILASAKPRWRPLLVTAAFTGLRSSELRGLLWGDIDLKAQEVHVQRRADRFRLSGAPKSEAGHRTVPLPPSVAQILKEWKLASAHKKPEDLVFPNGQGGGEFHQHIVQRGFIPAQIAAGIVTKDGQAKYSGLHALRHFYASWCSNRTKLGGLGLSPNEVKERLGHATITLTLDTYGHMFKGEDTDELDKAAKILLS